MSRTPTLWGLSPSQLHDRFWASRGVQVVRRGEVSEIVESAELYLLTDPGRLLVFPLRDLVDLLSWLEPHLLTIRVQGATPGGDREVVRHTPDGRFLGFERIYEEIESHVARAALTPHRDVARAWQSAAGSAEGWRELRRLLHPRERHVTSVSGRVFDRGSDRQTMAMIHALMASWWLPDSSVTRATRHRSSLWVDHDSRIAPDATIQGDVWVGAGREVNSGEFVAGPAVLWDAPDAVPHADTVAWADLEPASLATGLAFEPRGQGAGGLGKRLFDIVFSLTVVVLTLPLYPLIALAILIEDGRPVFFAHRRETRRGVEFPCLKFRSMRKHAELSKADLGADNVSDGPQFFIESDPRTTRVGRFLRRTQLDELPQFLNVLVGHMSVVGPRPSPRAENQFCPEWREARLSVRPGITGLWQIRRTRAPGLDFQEWIKFDLAYVERISFRLDAWIIWRTCLMLMGRNTS